MLQENQIKASKKAISAKSLSIIIRLIMFLATYAINIERNTSVETILEDLTEDFLYEHIDHIIEYGSEINIILEEYKLEKDNIIDNLDRIIVNNTIRNMGILGNVTILCIIEVNHSPEDTSLILKDYFEICNMFNIPQKKITFLNKIIKLYMQEYNI